MPNSTRFAILEAPSILGLRPTGVETLPEALLEAGLLERLPGRQAGRIAPRAAYDPDRDPVSLTLNAAGIAEYSSHLADSVEAILAGGELPLVLGGDCSILLGNLLALNRRGRYGLLFLDAHADFYQPEANPNGEVASMELAFATGRGPGVLANLENRGPLVSDEDIVVFGYRDAAEQAEYGSQPLPPALLAIPLDEIRSGGIAPAIQKALAHLQHSGGPDAGFWLHLDADVLDDAILPAVDYRLPGGLSPDELKAVLSAAAGTGRLIGMDLTIYNPKLDPGRSGAQLLVELRAAALANVKPLRRRNLEDIVGSSLPEPEIDRALADQRVINPSAWR
jgi:arginase